MSQEMLTIIQAGSSSYHCREPLCWSTFTRTKSW